VQGTLKILVRDGGSRIVKAADSIPRRGAGVKVFLSVDMEGICGVVGEKETDPENGGAAYQANCHRMTAEANAAIEGCLKAGATEMIVADSHWNFDNLIPEELHEAATLLRGSPRPFSMVQDLDASFDALLCVGYHAMAGTPRAILDHTFTGRVRSVEVNGRVIGETGLNAYVAGEFGVPVVLVTGDTSLVAEAKALLPGVRTVAVKEAMNRHAAKHLHPRRACDLIRLEAEKAVRAAHELKPLVASRPVRMGLDFKGTESADRAELEPHVARVGGTRVEFSAPDFREAFRIFYACMHLISDD
jgi:D-amino peptidase